ncbi:hypothetical protein GCM10028803_34250 [Larkinella knui]
MLDGETVKIGKSASDVYKFDEQNRLIQYNWSTFSFGGNGGQEIFAYTADQLIDTSTHLGFDKQVHAFPLNKQGLLGRDGLKYNEEGFLVEEVDGDYTTTYTIENGNMVRKETKSTYPNSPVYVTIYEYDLTKPNLPNPFPYRGKSSRNLPVKVISSDGTSTSSSTYKYIFDESGTRTRRYQKVANGQYSVVDYTITCR